jgi:hypothetical protein
VLGPEHKDTLRSIGELALIISARGRWKEAEELQAQLLEGRKESVRARASKHTV